MDNFFPNTGYPTTGQEVEPGTYICIMCPHDTEDDKAIVLLDKKSKLPKCPSCENPTGWMKL